MKQILYSVFITLFSCTLLTSQGYSFQLIVNNSTNTVDFMVTVDNEITFNQISTLSGGFKSGSALITSVSSAIGLVKDGSNFRLSAPYEPSGGATWPVGVPIKIATLNVTPGTYSISDFQILPQAEAPFPGLWPTIVVDGVPNVASVNSTVLPIKLKSFTAYANTNNSVLLEWTSSSEINSSHFDIERSEDGLNWEKLGEVQAAGNSNIERHYSYIDRDIVLRRNTTKVFYYRLNMIDQDASQEYSDVKAVRLTNEGYADVTLFPNPTAELLNIDVSSDLEDGNIKYEITDIQGRRLITESIDISVQRIHTVNLKDRGLDSGVYMVRLFNDQEMLSSQKVVLVSH